MKKTALLALIATMMITSSACGSQQSKAQAAPNSTDGSTAVSAEQNEKPDEPVVEVNYVAPPATPAAESASQPETDEDVRHLQKPTEATEALRSTLESGDLSGIVGTYYSEKYGYATISEDGGITFAEVTDYDGKIHQNLKYMPLSNAGGAGFWLQGDGKWPYLYWNIRHELDYSSPLSPALGQGQEILTLFPVGIEVAWRGVHDNTTDYYTAEYYMPSDTSKIRLFIQGDGHGTGVIEDRLDADAYFVKQEMSETEPNGSGTTSTTITLEVAPFDARIYLDGTEVANKETTQVSPGNHTVKVERDGFISKEQQVEVVQNRDNRMLFALIPSDGDYQWYIDHPDDSLILDSVGSAAADTAAAAADTTATQFPVLDALPYETNFYSVSLSALPDSTNPKITFQLEIYEVPRLGIYATRDNFNTYAEECQSWFAEQGLTSEEYEIIPWNELLEE